MCNRQYGNVTLQPNEHNVVWKVVNGKSSYLWIRETGNESPCVWKLLEVLKRLLDLSGKSFGHLAVPLAVPLCYLAQLTAGSWP